MHVACGKGYCDCGGSGAKNSRRSMFENSSNMQGRPLFLEKDEWKYKVVHAPVKTKERMTEKLMEYLKSGETIRPLAAKILDPIRCRLGSKFLRACDSLLCLTSLWMQNDNSL